jgi:hypothetical protein
MPRYEYKVVPAPNRAAKVKGVKGTEARFAVALSEIMNEMGADGWEYQRTDTLPCEERAGLTRKTTSFQNMLVFRRVIGAEAEVPATEETMPEIADAREPVLAIPAFRRSEPLSTAAPEGRAPVVHAVEEADGAAPRVGPAGE